MTITLLMDVLVAGLLVAAITYSILLNRRLGALRADKDKLEEMVRGLEGVSLRAEGAVASLRDAAEEIGRHLQEKVERGQGLRDDLAYMLDRGGALADRLERAIRTEREREEARPAASEAVTLPNVRGRTRPRRVEPAGPSDTMADGETGRITGFPSRAERELRRALDGRR